MSNIVVTTLADENDGGAGGTGLSLREALTIANASPGGDTISFAASLSGKTIQLSGSGLTIGDAVSIDGDLDNDGTADITISGGNSVRPFFVASGGNLSLDGVIVSGGLAHGGDGGSSKYFYQGPTGGGSLAHNEYYSHSGGSGGGLGAGGAIYVDTGGSLSLTDTQFDSNRAIGGDGGGAQNSVVNGVGYDGGLGPLGSTAGVGTGSTQIVNVPVDPTAGSGGNGGFGNGGGSGGGGTVYVGGSQGTPSATSSHSAGGTGGFGAGGGGTGGGGGGNQSGAAGGWGGGAGGGYSGNVSLLNSVTNVSSGGGGGAGLGGAIFGSTGSTISIGSGVSFTGDSAAGGHGGQGLGQSGQSGQGIGQDIFVLGGTLTLSVDAGQTQHIANYADATGYGGGASGLVKTGAGTLVLDGSNPFSGGLTLQAGTLEIDGSSIQSTIVATNATVTGTGTAGAVTIGSGASFAMTGTAGAVSISAGGHLAIGGDAAGAATVSALTLASGATAAFTLGGSGAGQYDVLHVNGAVELGGATLSLDLLSGTTLETGRTLTLIDNDGSDAVQGYFAGYSGASIVTAANRTFLLTYNGGDGNDVQLIALPNQAPRPIADSAQLVAFGTATGNVIANDSDPESQQSALAVSTVASGTTSVAAGTVLHGSYGTLTLLASGDYSYVADHASGIAGGSTATDSFTYTLVDPLGAGATTTLTFTVTPAAALSLTGDGKANMLTGGGANDMLAGGGGNDTLSGGAGNDQLDGGSGADSMAGGQGDDRYVVDDAHDVVVEAIGGGIDTVIAKVSWTATAGSEIEHVAAAAGTAAIRLTGNSFDQELDGNDGRNTLDGGAGADTLVGGAGNDSYRVDAAGDVVVEQAKGGIDTVTATTDAYTLADYVENLTYAGTGAFTGTGNGSGNQITGGDHGDTLHGLTGDDVLTGGGGDDALDGGDGADTIDGGDGADTITGGAGADRFLFGHLADVSGGGDAITDFSHADKDKIDLSGIDANRNVSGNQAFTFIGTGDFTHVAGQLHYVVGSDIWSVEGDVNGDGVADFRIDLLHMAGAHALVGSDFIL